MNLDKSKESLKLSIIVPVYNVENYLEKCLDSLVAQTLSKVDYEVILVDDKSTDTSLEICKKYVKNNFNFKLIQLPQHTQGGAGIPSNRGLEKAKGKYIGFIDSDDFALPNMFEELVNKGLDNCSDLVICSFFRLFENNNKIKISDDDLYWKKAIELSDKKENILNLQRILLQCSVVPWRKIYKRSFLEECFIKFPESPFFYEDNPFHWYTITQAKSISLINKNLVVHRKERKGQTTKFSPERAFSHIYHCQFIMKFLIHKDLLNIFKLDFIRYVTEQYFLLEPLLGEKNKEYVSLLKEVLNFVTINDLIRCKILFKQRKCVFIYNILLLMGYNKIAVKTRRVLLNRKTLGGAL